MNANATAAKGNVPPSGQSRQADAFSIFFLQRLHEALFDYSADSYKAPALNTHLRVIELRNIGAQAEVNEFLPASIESFFEELEWSVTNDPVLKGSQKELIRELTARAKSGWGKASQFMPAISALELQFNRHFQRLKEALLGEAQNERWSKQRVIQLLDNLIVELGLVGFPRSNVYAVTQKINAKKRKGRLNKGPLHTVELFLKHFGTAKRKYSAQIYVSQSLAEAVSNFPNWTRLAADQETENAQISGWIDYQQEVQSAKTPALVSYQIDSLCAQSAARACLTTIDRISEQISFVDHHINLVAHDKVFCVETSLRIGVVCPRPLSPLRFVTKTDPQELGKALGVFKLFFTDGPFIPQARRRLARAFEYHSAALSARRPEDQLLNLWSCLEGFVGVPASAGSKISFVREAVLSSLSLLYPQRLFSLTGARLVEVLGQEAVNKYLSNSVPHATENFERLALVLLCNDFVADRDALMAEVAAREPVLLFRIYELVQRFGTPKDTRDTFVKHRAKVAWQLNRIYWNRNLIVHSAESLPYLPTIVEHLHVYVDSFLVSILMVSASERATTIPSVLQLIDVHEKHRLQELNALRENVQNVPVNVLNWVFGQANVLRPLNGL